MRRSKLIVSLLTCCLLFAPFSPTALAKENSSDSAVTASTSTDSSTDNTENSYLETIHLSTVEDLLALTDSCRLDTWSIGRLVILEADIDLTDTDFISIPTFGGTFDGNGYTIRGLSITKEGNVQGLFRYLQSTAIIHDLHVEGQVQPTGTSSTLGGIAGTNAGQILECTFTGHISGTDRIGGLVGNNEVTGILEDCSVYGTIQGSHFVGGMTGDNHGVIRNCTNHANINTTSSDNNIALEDITLESITNSEAAYTTTDMGGIAGTSSGVIRGCTNYGNVGYPSMSYNAGGISGSLTGYLVDCKNHGQIQARKDVGGIVGQLEPSNVIEYDKDTLQILSGQIDSLSNLANRVESHAATGSKKLDAQLKILRIQGSDARSAAETLLKQYAGEDFDPEQWIPDGFDPDNFDPDNFDPDSFDPEQWFPDNNGPAVDPDTLTAARNDLSSSLNEISGTLDSLTNSMGSTLNTLTSDITAMTNQLQNISSTLNNAEDTLGITLTDISDLDTESDTIGKISSCDNYGSVHADQNGGGIVGTMGMENDLDPEEDIRFRGDQSLNMVYETRAVARDCRNHAVISLKKSNGGGIVGTMNMGAVLDCVNTGSIDAKTAQSVGGIAGSSSAVIRRCDAKGTVSGQSQVGGIAGIGSVVTDCRSVIHLQCDGPKIGAILGSSDNAMSLQAALLDIQRAVNANYYLATSHDPGAVDGISYEGCAQPMTLPDFLAIENLPEYFTTMTVSFVAEGQEDISFRIPVGEPFPAVQIPAVPAAEFHNGQWDGLAETDLSSVWYDMSFTAVYDPYDQTLQTEDVRENGLPILLAEGQFPGGAILTLDPTAKAPTLPEGATLLESWQITTIAESELFIHYQPSSEALEHVDGIHIYVQDSNGTWTRREASMDGRYLIFGMAQDETTFCALQMPRDYTPYYLAACGVGILITLILIVYVTKRRRRNKETASAIHEDTSA